MTNATQTRSPLDYWRDVARSAVKGFEAAERRGDVETMKALQDEARRAFNEIARIKATH